MEDSDEEEIFSSSKHRSLPHHECSNLNGQNHLGKNGGHGNEYQLLNNNDADLKTVLDTPITIWTPTPMSPARRACFIASIMFGILVVATFLWVLPCDVQPCEGELAMRDTEWAVKIERMVISQTQLVQRLTGGHNVLLSYHPSVNISSWDPDNSSLLEEEQIQFDSQFDCTSCVQGTTGNGHCGLLMLDGNLGRKNWRVPMRECAVGLQCDLLDVSGDGVPDCIVRGSNTMLFVIEVRYGNILWHAHQHRDKCEIMNVSIGGPELVPEQAESPSQEYSSSETQMPETDPSPYSNHLVLVCGQSEEEDTISIKALLHQILGDTSSSEEPETFHKLKQINNQHASPSNQQNLCELFVFNNGVCPQCQSKVKLKTDDGEVLWQKDYEHSTVVSWAPLLSDNKCHGAILKVWELRHVTTTVKTAKPPPAMNRRTTRSSLVSEEMENFETEPTYIEKESEDEIHQKISLEENSTSDSHEKLEVPSEVFLKSPQKQISCCLYWSEGENLAASVQQYNI
ncbi:hypothetical protein O3P69_002042 [Scylla paramamosain]